MPGLLASWQRLTDSLWFFPAALTLARALRLILPGSPFERVVGMAFDQIRHYGVGNPTVATRLLATTGELARPLGAVERAVLEGAMRHTLAAAEAQIRDAHDVERVRAAAARALETAPA